MFTVQTCPGTKGFYTEAVQNKLIGWIFDLDVSTRLTGISTSVKKIKSGKEVTMLYEAYSIIYVLYSAESLACFSYILVRSAE